MRFGMVIAVVGSAVGLGNYLRFPGQMALYGGIAFMIPYFCALVFLGLPLALSEWTLGRYGGIRGHSSAPGIFRSVVKRRRIAYTGSLFVMMPVVIFSYYILIEGWCLLYAIQFARGMMHLGTAEAYGASFANLVGASQDGAVFQHIFTNQTLLCIYFSFALNFYLIYCGINKGIQLFCTIALPALLICSVIIFIRVATLGNPTGIPGQSFFDGLKFVCSTAGSDKTILQQLARPECWLAAAGQVFFSLSVGFGLVLTYASYMNKDDEIASPCVTAVASNSFIEIIFGGLMIVPAAIMFLGPTAINKETIGSPFALGFHTLPTVFEQMPLGQFFGFLFFVLLFLAAVTSSISMLQPAIALFEDGLGLKKRGSVILLAIMMFFASMFVIWFSKDLVALDTFDFWIANIFVFLAATFQIILFGWGLGIDTGMSEMQRGSTLQIPWFMRYLIKYIAPLFLLIVFSAWCWLELPNRIRELGENRVAQLSVGAILLIEAFFLWVVSRAIKRWNEVERQLENE